MSEPDPYYDDNPFHDVKFPETVTSLTLTHTDLNRRFPEIKTLTKLVLCDYEFHYPPDTLLDFLEGNPFLQHVELSISPVQKPPHRKHPIKLENLESLSVTGMCHLDVQTLISSISIPKDAVLKILPLRGKGSVISLSGILYSIKDIAESPPYVYVDYTRGRIELSGSNGKAEVEGIDDADMSNLFKREYRPFAEYIQKLQLVAKTLANVQPLSLSLFPNLKTLIVEVGGQIETTLSRSSTSLASTHMTHLYKPFQKIETLTKLVLRDYEFPYPPDTLLDLLEGNPSLQQVELSISFVMEAAECRSRREHTIKLENLESLSVTGVCHLDVHAIVSFISIPKDAVLKILPLRDKGGVISLSRILFSIKDIADSSPYVYVDYAGGRIKLSGSNGKAEVEGIGNADMSNLFKSEHRPFTKHIQKLQLVAKTLANVQPLPLSLFPNLKTLIVEVGGQAKFTFTRLSTSWDTCLGGFEINNFAPPQTVHGSIEQIFSQVYNIIKEQDPAAVMARMCGYAPTPNVTKGKD